ncbi:uncharacterized protein LOC108162619 isoform X1 [Drosophila miranda]|uniref:uncharacterized protein LOC108162619 isoform X1 n=1 Tax=Drosophila miranda TaxID=7229 RepID=UPI0007E7F037|nr:uncharacterized protein LOC108162619 isoform X1 [Drosophila miranda]
MAMPPQGGGGGSGGPLSPKFVVILLVLVPLIRAGGDAKGTSTVITTTAPQMGNRSPHQQQRLQLLQEAQQLEAAHQHHHHLRHEQHLRAELEGNHKPPSVGVGPGAATAMKLFDQQLPPAATGQQQHHLRHHNRHHVTWEQRVFPSLRHQQHRLAMSSTPRPVVTTEAPHPPHSMMGNHSRYFDRDGIYPPWAEPRSTRGPNWRQEVDTSSEDADDDDDDDDDDEDYEYEEDSGSNAVDEELARQMPRYSLFSQKLPHIESKEEEYDAYDQSDESDMNSSRNKHPSVGNSHDKAAAKRNIFDWLFKRDKEKEQNLEQDKQKTHRDRALVVVRKPHTTERPTEKTTEKPTLKPKLQLIDANLQEVDEEDSSDDTDTDTDADSDSEESFSNEQWNKIEHEHHLKQQKHQKELQALRETSRNTPLIRGASYNIENEVSAAKTLEDGNDGHDVENIYSPNYITGKLTQRKEEQLGTPEAALKARRQQALKQKRERALAQAHMHQVMADATCRVPQPRCQRVQQDPSKIYTPHCTVLHRCSEDSGCCPSRTQICAAKSTHNVELHFFVKSNKQHRPIIEKRTFVNHTECHCIERSNFKEDAVALASTSIVRATILSCTCPRSFEVILQDNGQCRCDCSSGNYDCDWLKRGNEHFAVDDRKCIKHGGCKPPTCEYGHYMDKHGRCPKQHEQPVYNAMS